MSKDGDLNSLEGRVSKLEDNMTVSDQVFTQFSSAVFDKFEDLSEKLDGVNSKLDSLIKLLDERLPGPSSNYWTKSHEQ